MQNDFYTVATHVSKVHREGRVYPAGPKELAILREGLSRVLLDRDAFGHLVDPLVADRHLVLSDNHPLPDAVRDAILNDGFDAVSDEHVLIAIRSPLVLFDLWDAMKNPTPYWLNLNKMEIPVLTQSETRFSPVVPSNQSSPSVSEDDGKWQTKALAKWGRRFVGGLAACLVVASFVMSLKTVYARDGEREITRLEQAKRQAEEAAKSKQTITRLKSELQRRCKNSLLLIDPAPVDGKPDVTRATLVYQWFCYRETAKPTDVSHAYFFNTYEEYWKLSTCQLLVLLRDALADSRATDADLRRRHVAAAENANRLLTRCDEIAMRNFHFQTDKGATGFEADIKQIYPDLLVLFDELK